MLFCHIYIAFSAHGRIWQISMYFRRYLIGSILTAYFAVVIKYLGKYLTMCLILSCAKEAIYKRQNSIFYILHKYVSEKKKFTKIGVDSGFACKWLVGVLGVLQLLISMCISVGASCGILWPCIEWSRTEKCERNKNISYINAGCILAYEI